MRKFISAIYLSVVGAAAGPAWATALEDPAMTEQWAAYEALRPKSIVELQPFRQENRVTLASGTEATLITLNPNINVSFLLMIGESTFHIENPEPLTQSVALQARSGELLVSGPEGSTVCDLWSGEPTELAAARDSGLPYAPICEGRLYLRNAVSGSRSNLERVTDFLRDHVWQGEEIVRVVRKRLYRDKFLVTSDFRDGFAEACVEKGPCSAEVDPKYAQRAIKPIGFGVALADPDQTEMVDGAWYPAAGLDGVFASAIQPRTIAKEILNGPGAANRLDSIEGRALVYLLAFDLDRYAVGFGLGTDHPRLTWSPRPRGPARVRGLPGPDGVRDARPLVRSGMVPPEIADRTVATFTAGFKRQHGAFKFGDYATIDTGKHYGFIENGVIYSKLKTGLSTLYVLNDGTIDMKMWTEADDALLPQIVHARQNGVPLLTVDPETGQPIPGDRVNKWGPGNWSGSAKAELRTLRAGGCLQHHDGRRYLIYAYFSSATPSAMARTFQAYGCRHAMLLDMNALEHTYLALYPREDGRIHVEHLVTGMAQLDKTTRDGSVIPRFLGFPDNRDLFFIYRRKDAP